MKNFFYYDPKLLIYGFLIVFFASYGQTFFISLFNLQIRNFYGLSDGEFVLTAKAVRGAGGGDRDLGAARMYDMMSELERVA